MSSNNPYSAPAAQLDNVDFTNSRERNPSVFKLHVTLAVLYLIVLVVIGLSEGSANSIFAYIYVAVFVAIHAIAAWGARTGSEYSRWISRIVGVIMLFGIPIGTMIGISLLKNTGDSKWQKAGDNTSSADRW